MPEMQITILWNDGSKDKCYSPSSVITDYFQIGEVLPLNDFTARAETALKAANKRVQEKFGFGCGQAMHQIEIIKKFSNSRDLNTPVEIIAIESLNGG